MTHQPPLPPLKRVLTIMKTLVKQVDVLETMTPLSFNAFGPDSKPPAASRAASSGRWNSCSATSGRHC